jgi:cullin 1
VAEVHDRVFNELSRIKLLLLPLFSLLSCCCCWRLFEEVVFMCCLYVYHVCADTQVLDDELLVKYETELLEKEGSGCRVLLCNDMLDDLARMYRLFGRITQGLVPVADILRRYITDVGNEKVEYRLSRANASASASASANTQEGGKEAKDKADKGTDKGTDKADKSGDKGGAGADAEKESSEDPQFVKDLLSVHEKYMSIVNNQFNSNGLFQKALKDAFVEVVNRDVGKFKTAELLSSFCDRYRACDCLMM